MESNGIAERIRNFVVQRFPLAKKRQLQDQDRLIDGGILDSMGILEIVSFLEQDFQITIGDEDLIPDHFQTVEALVEFVVGKKTRIPPY